MYINSINSISFKSKRDDHNYVKKLAISKEPLNENIEINISDALKNLSRDASVQNIKFLLQTAKKLNYGVRENSEFQKNILVTSPLKDKLLSNTDWEGELSVAVLNALCKNNSAEKNLLQKEYNKVFNHKIPLTKQQNEIINLRAKILKSKTITNAKDEKRIANIKKNLDYFIFSSEISFDDKEDCLKQIANFVSSNYRINAQLKNKKIQVLDEILNDIIIKAPDEERLKIKDVDQQRHGMCAAIAACRKMAAYQDKKNYLSNIFSELNASPYMQIYDITQLGSGKKNTVKKTYIDFDDALNRGYRIIDASALQWMQNASRTGDGVTTNEDYTAFDIDNYEIFADSFWLANFPKELALVHEILKSTIKAREFAGNIQKTVLRKQISTENYHQKSAILTKELGSLYTDFEKLLKQNLNFPENYISVRNEILALNTTKKMDDIDVNERQYYSHPSEDDETKKNKLYKFLLAKKLIPENKLNAGINEIFMLKEKIISLDEKIKNSYFLSSQKAKVSFYKNLFNFAAAYRKTIENSLENNRFAEENLINYGLPNRMGMIKEHFDFIKNNLPKINDEKLIAYYASIIDCEPNVNDIMSKFIPFADYFEDSINTKIDEVASDIGLDGTKGLILEMLRSRLEQVEKNDKDDIVMLAKVFKIKPFQADVTRKLNRLIADVEANPTQETFDKILKAFQITDRISFLDNLVKSIATVYFYPDNDYLKTPILNLTKSILEKTKSAEDYNERLTLALNKINGLQVRLGAIEEAFNVPTPKYYVLDALEKKEGLISIEELNDLDAKFLEIVKFQNMQNEDKKAVSQKAHEVYSFSAKQLETLRKIKKHFSTAQRFIDRTYKNLNTTYSDELDVIYRAVGRNSGRFWSHEEGSSGLSHTNQIKIVEQITGKPYYIEEDLRRAVKSIKKGVGGGVMSTHVRDNEYSAHAQFVPAITHVEYPSDGTNLMSAKTIQRDVIWNDNSWGRAERSDNWSDRYGLTRTGYGSSVGGKDGYIVRNNDMNGSFVDELMYASGINKPQLLDNQRLKKLYDGVGDKYQVFYDILLPGEAPDSQKVAQEIFESIFDGHAERANLNSLLDKIKSGEFPNIDKYGSFADDKINEKMDLLDKKFSNIKSVEEFNKLPDDDVIKLIINKLSLTSNKYGKKNILLINSFNSQDDIEEYKNDLLKKLKSFTKSYIGFDTKLIKSPKSPLIVAYDKYLDDFENKYDYGLENYYQALGKSIKNLNNEVDSLDDLLGLILINLNNITDEHIPNKRYREKIKNDLTKMTIKIFDDIYDSGNILKNKDYEPIIAWLDKKFEPSNDEELKSFVDKIRGYSKKEIDKLLKETTLDDFGVEFYPSEHYFKLLKAENYMAQRSFDNMAHAYYANKYLPKFSTPKLTLGTNFELKPNSTSNTADAFFRNLYVILSYSEIQKDIKKQKEQALREYAARESFPNIDNFDEEKTKETTARNLEAIRLISQRYNLRKRFKGALYQMNKFKEFYNSRSKIYKQDYEETILPLLLTIDIHPNKIEFGEDFINKVTQIVSTPTTQWDSIEKSLSELNLMYNDISKTLNDEALENAMRSDVSAIKDVINDFAKRYIFPRKYQPKFKKLLNNYTREYIKNLESKKLDNIHNQIEDFICKHCYPKNPTEILKELVLLAKEDAINKDNKNKDLIEWHKYSLLSQLNAATQTELEFKILNAISTGKIYNLKKYINDIEIVSTDGEAAAIGTPKGMQALFNALCNASNNYNLQTVNLLAKHAGLSEKFYLSLKNKINIPKCEKHIDAFMKRINKIYADALKIDKVCQKTHFDENDKIEDIIERYNKNLNIAFAEDSKNKSLMIYKEAFAAIAPILLQVCETIKEKEPIDYKHKKVKLFTYLMDINHKKSLNALVAAQQISAPKINNTLAAAQKDLEIIQNLEVNKFSEVYKDKKAVENELERLISKGKKLTVQTERKMNAIYNESAEGNFQIDLKTL